MWKKTFREIVKNRSLFFSIFLMTFFCSLLFAALTSAWYSLEKNKDLFFEKTNTADFILSSKNVTRNDIERIRSIKSISFVEARKDIVIDLKDKTKLLISTFNSDSQLNQPMIVEGESDKDKHGIWINRDYALTNKIKVGSEIEIGIGSNKQKTKVLGIILQPEKLYFVKHPDDLEPDYKNFGFAYLSEKYYATIFPNIKYNQLIIKSVESKEGLLKKVISQVDNPILNFSSINELSGVSPFDNKIEQLKSYAFIFPSIFFLLAIVTIRFSVFRFINKQREVIGTLYAIGFSKIEIINHYIFFAVITSLLGGILGILIGPLLITPILLGTLQTQFSLPYWNVTFTYRILFGLVLMAISSIFLMRFSVVNILKQNPADIINGETPQSSSSHFFINKLFNKLNFSVKWVLRDILRHKERSFMGVFGTAGCFILLMSGFGLRDSINYTIDSTFIDNFNYNQKLYFDKAIHKGERLEIKTSVNLPIEWVQQNSVVIKQKDQKIDTLFTVFSGNDLLNLKANEKHSNILSSLKVNEIVITKKLANKMKLKEEDEIKVKFSNKIKYNTFKVKAISSLSFPQGIYCSEKILQNIEEPFMPSIALLRSTENLPILDKFSVEKVTWEKQYKQSKNALKSIMVVVILLIIMALLLGIVILNNYNTMIYIERKKEFSTLKVLGFKNKEIRQLNWIEDSFIFLFGTLTGVPLGSLFLKEYIKIASPDNQLYEANLSFQSWGIIFGIVIICTIVSILNLNQKIERLDIITELKEN